jgi:hypothetical protein
MSKHQEFIQTKEVLENLEPYIVSDFDLDRVFLKYKQLLGEVLEELNKTNQPCHNLVSKILKNNPQVADELFQLLSDFKFKVEEGIGEKE